MRFVFALLPLLLAVASFAAPSLKYVAVFETMADADSVLPEAEQRYLTNELRKQAVTALPTSLYSVLTRDNILALIPPDKDAYECFEGECLVEVGRNVGADYAVQGTVSKFGGKLTLTVEAYETMGGNLLGSFTAESADAAGLLESVRKDSPGLFSKISGKPVDAVANADSVELAKAISAAVAAASPQQVDPGIQWGELASSFVKTNWVGYTFDVLGVAALGTALFMNKKMGDEKATYTAMPRDPLGSREPFDKQWDKVKQAELFRNIGYIAGGVLLAGGVTFHIVF
jgi:hypothetical protein